MLYLAEEAASTASESTKSLKIEFLDNLTNKAAVIGGVKIPLFYIVLAAVALVAVIFLVLFIVFLVKANKRKKVWKKYKKATQQGKKLIAVPADKVNDVVAFLKEGKAPAAAAPAPVVAPAPVYAAPAPVATQNYNGPYVAGKAYDQGTPTVAKANSSYIVKDGQYVAKSEAYYVSEFENHVAGIENVARDPEGYFVAENYKVGVLLRKDEKVYAQVYFYLRKDNQVLSAPITVRVDNEEAYSKAAFLFDVAARDVEAL